jgi:hypothetical protein
MNFMLEAICRHAKRQEIAGIESDFNDFAIHIYLHDGSVRRYAGLARSEIQFAERLNHASMIFRHIHWHSVGDATPGWIFGRRFE